MSISAFAAIKTTGGLSGSLDDIMHTNIVDGDLAIVVDAVNDITYHYTYNSSSSASELDPDIIQPDSNSGAGRWIRTRGDLLMESYFYPDCTETDQGVTGNGKTIKAFVDAIGSDKATIHLRHNSGSATTTYTLTTSETIPDNISLEIENGAILDGAGTLTVNGPFECGVYKCFGVEIFKT